MRDVLTETGNDSCEGGNSRDHFRDAPLEVGGLNIDSDFAHICIPWGLVVVDDGLRIVFSNQRAMESLSRQNGIENRGGQLRAMQCGVDRSVANLVQRAIQDEGSDQLGTNALGVPDPDGRICFALKVLPCEYQGNRAALVVIADMVSNAHLSRNMLASLFSLSEREAEFGELFARGSRLDQIASHMAISENTARIHLRHIFLKTGCTSQTTLARLLARVEVVFGFVTYVKIKLWAQSLAGFSDVVATLMT
jgi:DNA-binding CsgD family transcriptional regulator